MKKYLTIQYSFLFLFLLLPLFFLSACSSERFGPSDEKADLDFNDVLYQQYQGVIQVKSFSVDYSHSLSEDRIDMDVTIVLQMDPNIEEMLNNYRAPFGGSSSHPLTRYYRKAKRINMGKEDYLTMHYNLTNKALWTYSGYSARNN